MSTIRVLIVVEGGCVNSVILEGRERFDNFEYIVKDFDNLEERGDMADFLAEYAARKDEFEPEFYDEIMADTDDGFCFECGDDFHEDRTTCDVCGRPMCEDCYAITDGMCWMCCDV